MPSAYIQLLLRLMASLEKEKSEQVCSLHQDGTMQSRCRHTNVGSRVFRFSRSLGKVACENKLHVGSLGTKMIGEALEVYHSSDSD